MLTTRKRSCRVTSPKKGPFWISVAGSVLFSLGWVLATYAKDLMALYLTMGVVLGIGSGFGYATPIPVLSKWFPDRRGLAVGLAVELQGRTGHSSPLRDFKKLPDSGIPAASGMIK